MPIEFSCSNCLASIRVPDSASGKSAQCPACGGVSPVPGGGVPAGNAIPSATPASPFAGGGAGVAENPFGEPRSYDPSNPYSAGTLQANPNPFAHLGLLADRGSRLLATLVDGFVVAGPFIVAIITAIAIAGGEPSDELFAICMIPAGIVALVIWIFNMYLTSAYGETIGKRIVSVRIVNEIDGLPPGFLKGVVVRNWVMAILSQCIPFIGLIDILFIFGDKRQCLHDMMASTRVVQGRYKSTL